jgi:hypothetical protein
MSKYQPGQSGNPNGKPKGTLSRRSQLAKLLEPHAEELVNKAVELAKEGDTNALRLCVERLLPKPKDQPVSLVLPKCNLKRNEALLEIGASLIQAVAQGDITPQQATSIATILENQRKAIETEELANRIENLEQKIHNKKH